MLCLSDPAACNIMLQSSAIITLSNVTWYYIQYSSYWGRTYLGICIHNRHPISRPYGWRMGCLLRGICRKLEQLKCLRSEDTTRRLMITHTIESYWIPSQKKTKLQIQRICQNFKFWNKPYTRHTFWSCLRCANMKWIRWVFLMIQSGHNSVHRRTDGQRNRRTRWNQYTPFQLRWSGGYN